MSTEDHNEFKLDSYNRRGVKRLGQSQTQALSAWGAWEENTPRTFHYKIANAELLAICSMVEKELEAVGKEMSSKYRSRIPSIGVLNRDISPIHRRVANLSGNDAPTGYLGTGDNRCRTAG